MGIGSDALDDVIWLKKKGYLSGSPRLIEIGAQQLADSFLLAEDKLAAACDCFSVDKSLIHMPAPKSKTIVHGNLKHLESDAPYAREFWQSIGFHYSAIDIDGSPRSFPLDLNFDRVPDDLRCQFNLVTNFGTTEHVCNQLNAFKIIHDLTKPECLMWHQLPAQGMMNHGLLNYNMKFFWMLARSNLYEIVFAELRPSHSPYALISDIGDFVDNYSLRPHHQRDGYETQDVLINICMRKQVDIEFVPPIDVPTGTKTDNSELKERYWTVFSPEKAEQLLNQRRIGRRRSQA